jgi:hypothetical protein
MKAADVPNGYGHNLVIDMMVSGKFDIGEDGRPGVAPVLVPLYAVAR